MPNVTLQPNVPTDIYTATGIAVGTKLIVSSNTPFNVYLSTTEAGLTTDFITVHNYGKATNDATDPGAWALCGKTSTINVQESA